MRFIIRYNIYSTCSVSLENPNRTVKAGPFSSIAEGFTISECSFGSILPIPCSSVTCCLIAPGSPSPLACDRSSSLTSPAGHHETLHLCRESQLAFAVGLLCVCLTLEKVQSPDIRETRATLTRQVRATPAVRHRVVTRDHLISGQVKVPETWGLKQQILLSHSSGDQKSKIKGLARWAPSESSRGESTSLPCPASRGTHIPWLVAPSSLFKARSLASSHLSLSDLSFIITPPSQTSCLPLRRTLVITLGHPDNPGQSLHLKILNFFIPAKSLLPYEATSPQVLGIRVGHPWGGGNIPYYQPPPAPCSPLIAQSPPHIFLLLWSTSHPCPAAPCPARG